MALGLGSLSAPLHFCSIEWMGEPCAPDARANPATLHPVGRPQQEGPGAIHRWPRVSLCTSLGVSCSHTGHHASLPSWDELEPG